MHLTSVRFHIGDRDGDKLLLLAGLLLTDLSRGGAAGDTDLDDDLQNIQTTKKPWLSNAAFTWLDHNTVAAIHTRAIECTSNFPVNIWVYSHPYTTAHVFCTTK